MTSRVKWMAKYFLLQACVLAMKALRLLWVKPQRETPGDLRAKMF